MRLKGVSGQKLGITGRHMDQLDVLHPSANLVTIEGQLVTGTWLVSALGGYDVASQAYYLGPEANEFPLPTWADMVGNNVLLTHLPPTGLVLLFASSVDRLIGKVAAPKKSHWPDVCDRCGAPAWVGFVQIQCSKACCAERR